MKHEQNRVEIPLSFGDLHALSKFIKELRFKNRFFLSDVANHFVDGLMRYAIEFKTIGFPHCQNFYRARTHEFSMEKLYRIEEMEAPPTHKATSGRLNPVGIPYLYLANDVNTAVSEVRPWVGCCITVAKFTLNKTYH